MQGQGSTLDTLQQDTRDFFLFTISKCYANATNLLYESDMTQNFFQESHFNVFHTLPGKVKFHEVSLQ